MTKHVIDPNSPFAMFETDEKIEREGVRIDYGPYYFQVARAGGANTRFRDVLRERLRPHKRAMATETMNDDLADSIGRDVFAETVVLGWGSPDPSADPKVAGGFGPGKIAGRDGKPIDFSVDAVKALFKALPVLAADLMAQAQSFQLFRSTIAELDAKN